MLFSWLRLMLSKGQRSVIEKKSNVDGSPVSSQHFKHVLRSVKVKIQEASIDLRMVHESDKELATFIDECFSWMVRGLEEKVTAKQESTKSTTPPHFPENMDELQPYEPDHVKAFKGII